MPNPILILNQQYVQTGPGQLDFTTPAASQYNVTFQATLPNSLATGDGAGSGTGLGSGAGGGGEGFTGGDLGPSHGGVGQGFGAHNGYQQPPVYGSNETTGPATQSTLVVTIKNGASTIYTSETPTPTQSEMKFKFSFQAAASAAIHVVLTSAGIPDNQLNSLKSQIQIGQGF